MICKCGSSDMRASSTVIKFNKTTLTVEVSAAVTCANCYRLLASSNNAIALNPIYHNAKSPIMAKLVLDVARWHAR